MTPMHSSKWSIYQPTFILGRTPATLLILKRYRKCWTIRLINKSGRCCVYFSLASAAFCIVVAVHTIHTSNSTCAWSYKSVCCIKFFSMSTSSAIVEIAYNLSSSHFASYIKSLFPITNVTCTLVNCFPEDKLDEVSMLLRLCTWGPILRFNNSDKTDNLNS